MMPTFLALLRIKRIYYGESNSLPCVMRRDAPVRIDKGKRHAPRWLSGSHFKVAESGSPGQAPGIPTTGQDAARAPRIQLGRGHPGAIGMTRHSRSI